MAIKIIKFRIKNYKAIKDSSDCYLTNNITILAGKNEAGKTSILEALADFDFDQQIRKDAVPKKSKLLPEIQITFNVNKNIINEILEECAFNIKVNNDMQIDISKIYPDNYKLSDESIKRLGLANPNIDDNTEPTDEQISLYTEIKNFLARYKIINTVDALSDINNLIRQIEAIRQRIKQTAIPQGEKEQFLGKLNSLIISFESTKEQSAIFVKKLNEKYTPYFILYSSFEDNFPHIIAKNQLSENEWAKDLSNISDFNPDLVSSSNEGREHKRQLNIELTNKFKKYWTQDPITLNVDWDSDNVYFSIEENGEFYEPKQRSKGQQWHLSYYIKVGARAKEDLPNIILIDEPGLYLHAKAQKDVLLSLEDYAKDSQVIFSTHSPYLIEADNLDRVRLVTKNKKDGTKILNKTHALADKETLTPILTAIGLGINDGIQTTEKVKNAVVEGPSDTFYLQTFKILYPEKFNNVNFIFGGGSGNMGVVGTILQGWGCKVIYLYDNDQGKRDGEKNLTKNWGVIKELIASVVAESNASIEKIFSKNDYEKHVLNSSSVQHESSNKRDKVLLARLFKQKAEAEEESIKFDNDTQGKIFVLCEKIKQIFTLS